MIGGPLDTRLASLVVDEAELARLRTFLSEDELHRGKRLLDKARRERFFAGRGIVREILGAELGEEPSGVTLCEGEFGKPRLKTRSGGLTFSVAHAGDYLLVALSRGREVGIDLEQVRQDLEFRPMAERYFSPREQEELFSLPESGQIEAFYRCWTRKEAYMKGIGLGFHQPSTEFDVSLLQGHPPALLAHRGNTGEPGRWILQDVEVPEGYCAALALGSLDSAFLRCSPCLRGK